MPHKTDFPGGRVVPQSINTLRGIAKFISRRRKHRLKEGFIKNPPKTIDMLSPLIKKSVNFHVVRDR